MGISLKSIRKLSQFLSSCIISAQLEDENIWGQLGGRNLIVEMDESCFFKRKNNKGRLQKEMWGFGLVERKSGRLFVEIVPKRNSATLVPIITK